MKKIAIISIIFLFASCITRKEVEQENRQPVVYVGKIDLITVVSIDSIYDSVTEKKRIYGTTENGDTIWGYDKSTVITFE